MTGNVVLRRGASLKKEDAQPHTKMILINTGIFFILHSCLMFILYLLYFFVVLLLFFRIYDECRKQS